jgi:hypothetical protein
MHPILCKANHDFHGTTLDYREAAFSAIQKLEEKEIIITFVTTDKLKVQVLAFDRFPSEENIPSHYSEYKLTLLKRIRSHHKIYRDTKKFVERFGIGHNRFTYHYSQIIPIFLCI